VRYSAIYVLAIAAFSLMMGLLVNPAPAAAQQLILKLGKDGVELKTRPERRRVDIPVCPPGLTYIEKLGGCAQVVTNEPRRRSRAPRVYAPLCPQGTVFVPEANGCVENRPVYEPERLTYDDRCRRLRARCSNGNFRACWRFEDQCIRY
jgi:hypothetical protein